jgi:hypothetical protein
MTYLPQTDASSVSGAMMTKHMPALCLFLAAVGCLAGPAVADTRDDVMAAMQRCSVMQDDRTWLECTYGAQQLMRAKLGLPPAPDYQQRLVPPASTAPARAPLASVAPAAPQPAAAPVLHASAAPAPVPQRRGTFMQILGGTAPPVAVSPLTSVAYDSQGSFIVTLQNGQIWRQIETTIRKARFRVGEKITIVPGALWSYTLKSEDNSRTFKVERRS